MSEYVAPLKDIRFVMQELAGLDTADVLYVGNMLGGVLSGQEHLGALVAAEMIQRQAAPQRLKPLQERHQRLLVQIGAGFRHLEHETGSRHSSLAQTALQPVQQFLVLQDGRRDVDE